MALSDCDSPTTVRSGTDYIDRLSLLRPNLWRFYRFTYSGGAYAVDPFTDPPVTDASSDQLRAIAMPGGDADIIAEVTDRTFGAATVGYNGGAYNLSFDAYLIGGATSATLRARFLSSAGAAISGISDESFAVTDVRTTFTWEHISSDDANWYAAVPNNAKFQFFVSSSSEIPAGSILYITNFQIQNDDYYAPRDIDLPWRPAPGEDNLAAYEEYILNTNYTELAAKPRKKVMSNQEGSGLILAPNGPTRVIEITGSSYTVQASDDGALLVTTGSSATSIFVQPASIVAFETLGKVQVRQGGTGLVTIVPGSGVVMNPPLGGSMVLPGKGSVLELTKRSTSDIWDVTSPANPIQFLAFEAGEPTAAVAVSTSLDSRRAPSAFTVTGVRANVHTAQTSGSTLTFDFKVGGVSILSTLLTIDNGEETSESAAAPAVISTTTIADDDKITFACTQIGDGTAQGARGWLIGYATNTTITGTALVLLEDQASPILLEDGSTALQREP